MVHHTINNDARSANHTDAGFNLVLSLFPGAGLIDLGFERAGYVVVRGPDTLLGQDVRRFTLSTACHAFGGIIAGPPCQDFSRARRKPPTGYGKLMLSEFSRLVTEGQPNWWLLENVPSVPDVHIQGYRVQRFNLFASDFGLRQLRNRSFQFGSRDGLPIIIARHTQSHHKLLPAALASDNHHGRRRNFADLCELQGLARDFNLPGLSRRAKSRAVGNGVPVPMAEAVALAIRARAFTPTAMVCPCECGRLLAGKQLSATPACRKRLQRSRRIHSSEVPG